MNNRCISAAVGGGLFLVLATAAWAQDTDIHAILTAKQLSSSERDIAGFYASRDFKPAWNEINRKSAQRYLSRAGEEGLSPEEYREKPGDGSMAASDIALTGNVLRYARDVHLGRSSPKSVYNDVDLPQQSIDSAALLDAALDRDELDKFLSGLPPRQAGYGFLRTVLAEYRKIQARGEWHALPPMKGAVANLSPGEQSRLLQRLAAEDHDIDLNDTGETVLDGALRRFQSRHGLEADGKTGPLTLAALNVPASDRVLQIEANMERWRWLPDQFEDRYVMVNAADASLEYIEDGKVVLASRIVVGKPKTPTPMFAATIVALIVNPPWNVPYSIARTELLPKLKKNPAYLAKEQMILRNGPPGDPHGITVNWAAVSRSHFPFQIQQLPGENNALGQLKLEMTNRFDVYLHDTPAKTLFAQNRRFFSHGCVRVQKIGALAKYALTGNPEADVARFLETDDKTQRLPLEKPLKVYVLYWTVFRNDDGSTAFRDDVYGRDRKLLDELSGKGVAQRVAPQPECSA